MATIIIPDGSTKPVKIPRETQIDIVEHPTGTKGYVLLHCTNPPEKIYYPLRAHPYSIVNNLATENCDVTNMALKGTPPGSSVDFITQDDLPVTEV